MAFCINKEHVLKIAFNLQAMVVLAVVINFCQAAIQPKAPNFQYFER